MIRLVVEATPTTGLSATGMLMVDKITTVRRTKLGERIGELDDADVVRLNRAVVTFLGLAGPHRPADRPREVTAPDKLRSSSVAGLTWPHANQILVIVGRVISLTATPGVTYR